MKKLFLLVAAMMAVAVNAEEITLDLTTATDGEMNPIVYETVGSSVWNGHTKDVWNMTLSEGLGSDMILANEGKFMFMHFGDEAYQSWNGWTISKNASDTVNQFACAAKGGANGEGSPFMVGYWSSYYGPVMLGLDTVYTAKEVKICQNTVTLASIQNGDAYAKKFTAQDTLALDIHGIDENGDTTAVVTYLLAVDSVFNTNWTTVDLTPLGNCIGFLFSMRSTDTGAWGMNTPAYFCLDALKVATTTTTGIENVKAEVKAVKRIENGQLIIEREGVRYNAIGAKL